MVVPGPTDEDSEHFVGSMRTLCGAQRVGPICLRELRDPLRRAPQVAGDRGRVATGDRAGQRRLPTLQRVLQRRPRQRTDHPLGDAAGRVADHLLPQQLLSPQRRPQRLDGVEQHGDDVVARMGQRGVVQRAGVLADPERLAADLEHQRLRDRVSDLVGGGDAEAGVGQSRDVLVAPVNVIAG